MGFLLSRCWKGGVGIEGVSVGKDNHVIILMTLFFSCRQTDKNLAVFEKIPRLKINTHKSYLASINLEGRELDTLANLANCEVLKFPIIY